MPSRLYRPFRRSLQLAVEPLEARHLLAAAWKVAFQDPGSAHAAYYNDIRRTLLAAGEEWNRYLPAGKGSIDVTVKFANFPSFLATGGSESSVFLAMNGALETWEPSAANELRTGKDSNGKSPDAVVTLNKSTVRQELWFDPTPGNFFDDAVPGDKYDAFSLFVHELGHVLGFSGHRDDSTGRLSGNVQFPFDRYVTMSGGLPLFTGPAAKAEFDNRSVPLTKGDLYHVGRESGALSDDVMSGTGMPWGQRQSISRVDAAILRDLGLPVVLQPANRAPLLSTIENQLLQEDASLDVFFSASDLDVSANTLQIAAASSNSALFPPSSLEVIRGSQWHTLRLRPAADASGSATITVSASDGGLTTTRSFQVTVTPLLDPPRVIPPPPSLMYEDQAFDLSVRVESDDTPVANLILTVSSNRPDLFGRGAITVTGQGDIRNVHLVSAPNQNTNQSSPVLLQFTVSDGTNSSTAESILDVFDTPDLPLITPIADQYLLRGEFRRLTFQVTGADVPISGNLQAAVESSNPDLLTAQFSGLASDRELQLITRPGAQGFAKVTLRAWNEFGESSEVFHVRVASDAFPWRNAAQPLDVDRSGIITPLDAIRIINRLVAGRQGPLEWPDAQFAPTFFFDVHPDNQVSPLDAILVINHLHEQARLAAAAAQGAAAAEGESSPTASRSIALSPTAAAVDFLLAGDSHDELLAAFRRRKR